MKPSAARTWLDNILAGDQPDSASLDRLIDECGPENLHHDYKAGAELRNEDKGGRTLRQYAAGFANADGGMLLLGVAKDGSIDGCPRPGGQLLPEWAARALAQQVAYLARPPQMFVVPYAGRRRTGRAARRPAEVLIVGVHRSHVLVPAIEGGRQVFYFRMGDSTLPAPDYLLADMILGRRSQPMLEVFALRFHKWSGVADHTSVSGSVTPPRQLILKLEIDNRSLVFAEHVRAGLVTWTLGFTLERYVPRPSHAFPNLRVREPPKEYPHDPRWRPQWMLAHVPIVNAVQGTGFPLHLGAFERSVTHQVAEVVLPVPRDVSEDPAVVSVPTGAGPDAEERYRASLRGRARLDAALYLVARNAMARWFQLSIHYQTGKEGEIARDVEPKSIDLWPTDDGPLVTWDYDYDTGQ